MELFGSLAEIKTAEFDWFSFDSEVMANVL